MTTQTFSDPVGQAYYEQGETEIRAAQSADALLRKADHLGHQDGRADITQAAFYYLAAADFLERREDKRAAHAYQQAGYHLHRLQLYTPAGRAYSNAGRVAEEAARGMHDPGERHHLQHLAVRAYSRANHCFSEAGELDWSEAEYLKEHEARVAWATMQGKRPWALLAWKATSKYGTSFTRWGLWSTGTVMLFTLLYEIFFRVGWLQPMETDQATAWIPVWSGLYYSINITSALGLVDYQPAHPVSQGVVIVNVIMGYLLLGIGIGIIGRLIRSR